MRKGNIGAARFAFLLVYERSGDAGATVEFRVVRLGQKTNMVLPHPATGSSPPPIWFIA